MTDSTTRINDGDLPGTALESVPVSETASNTFEQANIEFARLEFHPEEQIGDTIHKTGEIIAFTVPVDAVLMDDGQLIPEETSQMDELKYHSAAPERVTTWDGPFEIYYNDFIDAIRHRAGTATVTFHPQVPVNRRLVVPDDTWTFTVPVDEVLDADGNVIGGDTPESDRLANHENAPAIAQEWSKLTGWCYKITIDSVPEHIAASGGEGNDE